MIPFVAFLALLTIGGDFATQEADVSNEFTLLLVGLILLFMGVTELLGAAPGSRPELHARRRAAQDEEPRLSELFTQEVITALIAGGILAGIPLLFAALGEMVSERAGVLNIGIEGTMLVGAYVGFVAAYHGGSTSLGFLAGAGAGAAVSMHHGRPLRLARARPDRRRHRASRSPRRARPP